MDSTIPLLSKSEISSLQTSTVFVQPGLCRTWSETPKTGFLTTRYISFFQKTESVIAFATVLNNNRTLKCLNLNRPILFSQQEEETVHFAKMLKVIYFSGQSFFYFSFYQDFFQFYFCISLRIMPVQYWSSINFLAHLSQRLIGELIGYPWSVVVCHRRPSTISNVFSSETTWPIEAKFYVQPPWQGGKKFYINGSGHMTKMAATPIYGKNPSKIFSRTCWPIFTKLGM